jgi:cysteine desulfurase family protein
MALQAGRLIYETRELLAQLFGIKNPLRISFTLNATEALNQALRGLLVAGDHIVTSSMEHNSVSRPLHFLESQGVEVSKVPATSGGGILISEVEKAIRKNTKALIMTHASNVSGTIFPIIQLGELARKNNLVFMVDAAQTAGAYEINVDEMNIDLLAFPGHKGLFGPQGTGGLYVREGISLTPLKYGGTGSSSEFPEQPEEYPDRLESGTPNTVGIAGLGAGVKFILETGLDKIRSQEQHLAGMLLEGLGKIPGIAIYGPANSKLQAPVISVNFRQQESGQIGFILDQAFEIACRAGLHCAPDAHKSLGTFPQGTVRFSFAYFNTEEDVRQTIAACKQIAGEIR